MKKPLGIALVVTLLFALLLFIAIVTVSSSLSLSGKRVTANQKAALEAQYAAESGLALATTRLSLVGSEVADFIANVSDFEMPSGTDWASLRTYLQKFCGVTSEPGDPAFVPTDKPAVGSVICTADPDLVDWSDPRAAPYSIFLDGHIDASRYPGGAAPEDYWRTRLGPQTLERTLKSRGRLVTAYTVTYGFEPWRAEVLPNAAVRLTFRARPTVSSGFLAKEGTDVARHKIEQAFTGELRIDLRPPSFSHFMLFTNYQRGGGGGGVGSGNFSHDTPFPEPMHT
ncbi:PilX N-terminal domain-containing pilus assembly protein, partial [Oceanithermus profundus]